VPCVSKLNTKTTVYSVSMVKSWLKLSCLYTATPFKPDPIYRGLHYDVVTVFYRQTPIDTKIYKYFVC